MAALAMRALAAEGKPLSGPLRADTATVSVWGEYADDEDGAIKITYGHAKENNRVHSKQLQIGAASVGPGMPVFGEVLSGNSSDKTFNFETLEKLSRQLRAEDLARLVYIGDSQMVTSASRCAAPSTPPAYGIVPSPDSGRRCAESSSCSASTH